MAKAGLMVLTQPLSHLKSIIPKLLEEASVVVSDTLYICLQPAQASQTTAQPQAPFIQPILTSKEVYKFTTDFYSVGSKLCHNLDVRVLLSHICSNPSGYSHNPYTLHKEVSVLLSDSEALNEMWKLKKLSLVTLLKDSFTNIYQDLDYRHLTTNGTTDLQHEKLQEEVLQSYPNVVIGGTFDRLHVGHKLLLTESCLRTDNKLTVGITDGKINEKKILSELMESYASREKNVADFVNEVKPSIVFEPARIEEPFGPTITNPDLQAIVVSQETLKGGTMVNEERGKRGFPILDVAVIDLVGDQCHAEDEDEKVSSSSLRKRLLGTLVHPLHPRQTHSSSPYVIGVTGGIASGKSNICKELRNLGAKVIDCDLLGHRAYVKGTKAFHSIVKEFGGEVIGANGEIDRRKLGPIVFSDKSKLDKLNSIVWPSIRQLAEEEIENFKKDGETLVVLEAAVLLEANWQEMVHEIWTAFVPRKEAVKRIMERNKLSETEAENRIDSQLSNSERISHSNVVLCSLWEYDYTRKQVEKAWNLLKFRTSTSVNSLL